MKTKTAKTLTLVVCAFMLGSCGFDEMDDISMEALGRAGVARGKDMVPQDEKSSDFLNGEYWKGEEITSGDN